MNSQRTIATILALLCLCGAGCVLVPASDGTNRSRPAPEADGGAGAPIAEVAGEPAHNADRSEPWHEVAPGMERTVISGTVISGTAESGGTSYDVLVTMYRLDPAQFEARLLSDSAAPKSVGAWAATLPAADGVAPDAVVVNGAYFHEDQSPSGFMAVDGVRVGTRAFDQSSSGLLRFAPTFGIVDTIAKPVALDASVLGTALQSYPFLIRDGKPAVSADSGLMSFRTFVGTDAEGRMYVGSVTDDFVSLYGLARVLAAADIRWAHVLNLDGGSSTGLAATHKGAPAPENGLVMVPSAVAFVRR